MQELITSLYTMDDVGVTGRDMTLRENGCASQITKETITEAALFQPNSVLRSQQKRQYLFFIIIFFILYYEQQMHNYLKNW